MNTTTLKNTSITTTLGTSDQRGVGDEPVFSLHEGYFARRNVLDWLFAALVIVGGLFEIGRAHV